NRPLGIVRNLSAVDPPSGRHGAPERAILVGVEWKGRRAPRTSGASSHTVKDIEESLNELAELALTAGAQVVERVSQSRETAEAATLVGAGKVHELAALAGSARADVVVFDNELTPTQQ